MYGKWKFYNRSLTIAGCASEIRKGLEILWSAHQWRKNRRVESLGILTRWLECGKIERSICYFCALVRVRVENGIGVQKMSERWNLWYSDSVIRVSVICV